MKCPNCREEIPDDSKVCSKCGNTLELTKETAAEETSLKTETAEEATVTAEPIAAESIAAEPILVSEIPQKSSSKKIILGGIAAAAIIAIGAFAIVKMTEKDPKTVVIDAFKNIYSDETVYPIEEIFGMKELEELCRKSNTDIGFGFAMEDSTEPAIAAYSGSGFQVTGKTDVTNKKASANIGFQYAGMDVANASIYMDETNFMMGIPELSEKIFSLNYADDLQGQIKNSPFLGQTIQNSGMDMTAFSDYMDYIWSFCDTDGEVPFDIKALWERYQSGSQSINDFKAAMTVAKSDKQTFTMNGKKVKCKGYDVVISKDSMIHFLRTSSEFFMKDEIFKKDFTEYLTQMVRVSQGMLGDSYGGETPEELQAENWEEAQTGINEMIDLLESSLSDVTMKVYVDRAGKMAAVNATSTITAEDAATADLAVDLKLEGGSYLTQNGEAVITVTQDGVENVVTLTKQGTYDKKLLTCDLFASAKLSDTAYNLTYTGTYNIEGGDYHVEFLYDDPVNLGSVSCLGSIDNLKKGKSLNINMDTIEVKANDAFDLTLSGNYYVQPLEGEVTIPEGDQMDILAASEADWQNVIMEVYMKLFQIGSTLQNAE